MIEGFELPKNPKFYPVGGTYADLLFWHLYIWGTRSDGSRKTWRPDEFRAAVFNCNADSPTAVRSLNYWLGGGSPPNSTAADLVMQALFAEEDVFEEWRIDFRLAHKRSGGKDASGKKKNINSIESLWKSRSRADVSAASTPTNAIQIGFAAEQDTAYLIDNLVEYFVGRKTDIETINDFIDARMNGGARGLMVITAPPGLGKSALAAYWCKKVTKPTNRLVARHFCSMSNGAERTKPEVIYEHLHGQVAKILGEEITVASHYDELNRLLCKTPPDGHELVVWLDGIDEANGIVDCFIPYAFRSKETIADRVCVIVSARAELDDAPAYLAPWLTSRRADTLKPERYPLGKLSDRDVTDLVARLFEANKLMPPSDLASRIFNASDQGWPLFVRNMIESAIEAVREGRDVDLGEVPESFRGYAKVELDRLENLPLWQDLEPIFAFLTIAKDAISVADAPTIIGKRIFPNAFPSQFRRWLNVTEDRSGRNPPVLSLAHPLLADVFGRELASRREELIETFWHATAPQPYARWSRYALRHLPLHLLEANHIAEAVNYLTDMEFIAARFAALGADYCPAVMQADWSAWHSIERGSTQNTSYDFRDPTQHYHFWRQYTERLSDAARKGGDQSWLQMMSDIGLSDIRSHTGLTIAQSHLQPASSAVPPNPEAWIDGALGLPDGNGFISWNRNYSLRLWNAAGEPGREMHGHTDSIMGALVLPEGAGFLSWSKDKTLRLWTASGEARKELCGHESFVNGALALANGGGFLSWSRDSTLRLWSADGERSRSLSGHKKSVIGAVALSDGSGFISWSWDGTIRMWNAAGEPTGERCGHGRIFNGVLPRAGGAGLFSWSSDGAICLWGTATEPEAVFRHSVNGALALRDGRGFLSWSWDGVLRLWNADGEPENELHGHKSFVSGALEFPDGNGFLSWSSDGTLRLWDVAGNSKKELSGHTRSVNGALALPDGEGFLTWGGDGTLRLWDRSGNPRNLWLNPNGVITRVVPSKERNHHFVAFGCNVGVVRLPFPN